jgi:hypothetical protein
MTHDKNIALKWGACSKQTMDELAPKHNNQPHKNLRTMSNEWLVVAEPKETRKTTISRMRGGDKFAKFAACLVFISFYSSNQY